MDQVATKLPRKHYCWLDDQYFLIYFSKNSTKTNVASDDEISNVDAVS